MKNVNKRCFIEQVAIWLSSASLPTGRCTLLPSCGPDEGAPLGLSLRTAPYVQLPALRLLHVKAEQAPLARQSPQANGKSYQQLELKARYTELVRTKVMVTSSILRKQFCCQSFWKLDVKSILDKKHKACLLIFW